MLLDKYILTVLGRVYIQFLKHWLWACGAKAKQNRSKNVPVHINKIDQILPLSNIYNCIYNWNKNLQLFCKFFQYQCKLMRFQKSYTNIHAQCTYQHRKTVALTQYMLCFCPHCKESNESSQSSLGSIPGGIADRNRWWGCNKSQGHRILQI